MVNSAMMKFLLRVEIVALLLKFRIVSCMNAPVVAFRRLSTRTVVRSQTMLHFNCRLMERNFAHVSLQSVKVVDAKLVLVRFNN